MYGVYLHRVRKAGSVEGQMEKGNREGGSTSTLAREGAKECRSRQGDGDDGRGCQ